MTLTMTPVRVRIHITDGQRQALLTLAPADGLVIADHTAAFDMPDPVAWLEATMAPLPRGVFPRARLNGVLRKLSAAIQGQIQPDRGGEV